MDVPHPHPPSGPDTDPEKSITGLLVIGDPIAAADVPELCERLTALVAASAARIIVCDVCDLPANTQTIDTLARLQLTARRHGRRIRLQRATQELQSLLEFVGLADVVPARHPGPF